jgi:dCMP deaminase
MAVFVLGIYNWSNMKKKTKVKVKVDTPKLKITSPIQAVDVVKSTRPSWDEYFMNITEMVGSRATCDRGKTGCVIVKDKHILTTGYVGSPRGVEHCDELGHEMNDVVHPDGTITKHCVRTIHGEMNAVAQAARLGIPLEGATLYCKMTPCYTCAKILINAGIVRIVARRDYHAAERSKELFKNCGIDFKIVEDKLEEYPGQR